MALTYYLANFSKNCTKVKTLGPRAGARVTAPTPLHPQTCRWIFHNDRPITKNKCSQRPHPILKLAQTIKVVEINLNKEKRLTHDMCKLTRILPIQNLITVDYKIFLTTKVCV